VIEAVQGKGVNRARVTCDGCGRVDTVTCDYLPRRRGMWEPNAGQINKKLTAAGWAVSARAHECPVCTARKRAVQHQKKEAETMAEPVAAPAAAAEVRRPTGLQKRLIVAVLEDAYDDQAKRYRGAYTDKVVAEELGEGIMFGWVAEIREEMFGPSGGNEEIEAIRGQIQRLRQEVEQFRKARLLELDARVSAAVEALAAELDKGLGGYRDQIEALERRLDLVCAAVGPRAGAKR